MLCWGLPQGITSRLLVWLVSSRALVTVHTASFVVDDRALVLFPDPATKVSRATVPASRFA